MDSIKLESVKDFYSNDIYFIEIVSDKIIMNDNYNGILILDSNLNIIKQIKLLDNLVIDIAFINNERIVLYLYENNCLIYIDTNSYYNRIIFLDKYFEDTVFLSLYEWVENDLVLMADNGLFFVHINLLDNKVKVIDRDIIDELHFSIYKHWSKLNEFVIHKVYSQKCEAVVEYNNLFKLINYKNNTESTLNIVPFETAPFYFYDIEISGNCIAQISEKTVSVLCDGKVNLIYPYYKDYRYLRGKFININGKKCLILLSGSDSESNKSAIERYCFDIV